MKATVSGGRLAELDCSISIPYGPTIKLKALPDIDDQKEANYESDPGIGRTQPFMTYTNSGFRKISLGLHFFVTDDKDVAEIWSYIRALQSLVYPGPPSYGMHGMPYVPPAICSIHCGMIFDDTGSGKNGPSGKNNVCAVCTSVGVKYGTEVVFDEKTYLPWKVDVNTSWNVVYKNSDLPGSDMILNLSTGEQ